MDEQNISQAPHADNHAAWARRFGNRTNSLVTLYPGFKTAAIAGNKGIIRFVETGRACIAASEPLAPPADRAEALRAFVQAARAIKKRGVVFPVGKGLADELQAAGLHVWQIGSEPIFELEPCFSLSCDPLDAFPLARALKKRGGHVEEVSFHALDDEAARACRNDLAHTTRQWLQCKGTVQLGFLTQVRPFDLEKHKRYFVLRVRAQTQGFLTALPFYEEGRLLGYYFVDSIRAPWARAGTSELMILEAMRRLRSEGVAEVRLGMAPLALIAAGQRHARLLRMLFERWRWGYNFKSLYQFKNKLRPTRWEHLYLASTSGRLSSVLRDVIDAHFPGGWSAALAGALPGVGRSLELLPGVRTHLGVRQGLDLLPQGPGDYLRRTKYTTLLTALFMILHLLRLLLPPVNDLFVQAAYVPGRLTLSGVALGPLFHNNARHLLGDQLSFYAFGAIVELILGPRIFWIAAGLGLWASNPLVHCLYGLLLPGPWPSSWSTFLAERDYGSSNAAFALVAAYAAALQRRVWLLAPFIWCALFFCAVKQSYIVVHHLAALAMGFAAVWLWRQRKAGHRP